MMKDLSLHKQRGVTLVEIVITIVVLSVGVSGILNVMWQTTTYSADPMQRQQALNIAQAYMEEILAKPFLDPSIVQAKPPVVPCTALDAPRTAYDDICDYTQISTQVPTDVTGTAIAGLNGYNVELRFNNTSPALGPAANQLTVADNQLIRVEVEVTPPGGGDPITISAYRTPHY